jgi:Fe-S-cluster formation regulator IscX/YfhJ
MTAEVFDIFKPKPLETWQLHQVHSETSIEAGASVKPRASKLREMVFEAIQHSWHGLTDQELYAKFPKIDPNTLRPRRIELHQSRRIISAGTRKTLSNRSATVWVARKEA